MLQKGLECKVQWYETQVRREVDRRESEAAKHAQQQEQLQASRDALQKQLAVTETEFRLALQVMLPPCYFSSILTVRVLQNPKKFRTFNFVRAV